MPGENPYETPLAETTKTENADQGRKLLVDPVQTLKAAQPAIIFLAALAGIGAVTHFLQFCFDARWLLATSWNWTTAGMTELNILWLLVMAPLYGWSSMRLWRYSGALRRATERDPAEMADVSVRHTRAWNATAIATGAKFIPFFGECAYWLGTVYRNH